MIEYETTEFVGDGYRGKIHKPILTAEERHRREAEQKKALARYAREVLKCRKQQPIS